MKTLEWTPKRRSRALELIQGGWHSLSEKSHITKISKGLLGNLKKRNTSLNKVWSRCPPKLYVHNKHQIVFCITRNYESYHLSIISIIQNFQLNTCITRLKCTFKNLGYNHRIAWYQPFLKKLDCKHCLQFTRCHTHFTIKNCITFI